MDTILFDPTVEKLQSIIAATSQITASDLSDDAQLAVVRGTRLQLRDARVTIEKQGKQMRADALKYQKDVIARERELIGIIEPEEVRLHGIEEEATAIRERAARASLLPMRHTMLSKYDSVISDEDILDMDNDQFMDYLGTLETQRTQAEQIAREAQLKEEQHKRDIAEAEDRARIQERERIERETKDAEAKVKDEIARKEADSKYQTWLISIGYKKEEDALWVFKRTGDTVNAFKFVKSFIS